MKSAGALAANVVLAVSATTCLKLSRGQRVDLTPTAYLLNAASFSMLPFVFAHTPLAVAHVTVSSGVALLSLTVGYLIFDEVPEAHELLGVLLFFGALVALHGSRVWREL